MLVISRVNCSSLGKKYVRVFVLTDGRAGDEIKLSMGPSVYFLLSALQRYEQQVSNFRIRKLYGLTVVLKGFKCIKGGGPKS